MHVAVGVGECERGCLDRGVTMGYVLFSDRWEEVGLRDRDLLIRWFRVSNCPKSGGPKVRKGFNSRDLELVFGCTLGKLGKEGKDR